MAPMSSLLESYRRNAEAARLVAERSVLPNARQRAETDAETWTRLADRLERLEAMQAGREQT